MQLVAQISGKVVSYLLLGSESATRRFNAYHCPLHARCVPRPVARRARQTSFAGRDSVARGSSRALSSAARQNAAAVLHAASYIRFWFRRESRALAWFADPSNSVPGAFSQIGPSSRVHDLRGRRCYSRASDTARSGRLRSLLPKRTPPPAPTRFLLSLVPSYSFLVLHCAAFNDHVKNVFVGQVIAAENRL